MRVITYGLVTMKKSALYCVKVVGLGVRVRVGVGVGGGIDER